MKTTILNLTSGIDITIWGLTVLPLKKYRRKHTHPDKGAGFLSCRFIAEVRFRRHFPPLCNG